MSKFFYVYDEGPTRHYPTLEEAKADAIEQIDWYRENCDPEWSDTVEWIAVYECEAETDAPEEDGLLVLESMPVNIRKPDEGEEGVEFYCDYDMIDRRLPLLASEGKTDA